LQSLGYTEPLAYDPADQARNRTKEDIRITGYSSLDEVWAKKPEVPLVTAVTQAHVDLSLEAARHGCQLFIEKPLSHSILISSNLKALGLALAARSTEEKSS